jgi:ubiquinone/menaquinone biosynthesis C-methylase UbiE
MHHLSSAKARSHNQSSKPHQILRPVAGVVLIAIGAGVTIHLFTIHVSYWWLPLIVFLVLGHGTIVGGLAWLVTRHRHNQHDVSGGNTDEQSGHSYVLHSPRVYDLLASVITLGGEKRFRRRTLDLADLRPGNAVLDVGCGTGTLLIEAAKRVRPSGSAHGVDRSAEMLAYARSKAAAQGVAAIFVEESSDRLPFSDASFDVVFCTLMLHHLPAPMQMGTIAEMQRVLRPGGRIIIVDMQRPAKISARFSHIGLIHMFSSHAMLPDWPKIEGRLTQKGVQLDQRRAVWGEIVCALVGRKASKP